MKSVNCFAVGFANGILKLCGASTCQVLAQIHAHSRQINAAVAHLNLPLLATVSDDTLVNVWEITSEKGDKEEELEVKDVKLKVS